MTSDVRARRVTPTDQTWQKALLEYLPTQGTKAREAAQKWATQAAAILGLIAITTIFKGKETLDAIEPGRRDLVVLLVVGSLVAAFVTLLFAAWASRGEFKEGWATPGNMEAAQVAAVKHANKWTGLSMCTVVVAFGAALVAVGLIWTSPKPPSMAANVLVVGGDNTRACGELKVQPDGRLTAGGADLPAAPRTFVTVEKCP